MKKFFAAATIAFLGWSMTGCSNWSISNKKPVVATGLAENREERMSSIVENLRAKGYSEDRAKQVAARQVPLVETTYSESLASIFSGDAKKKKFAEDLARSEGRP